MADNGIVIIDLDMRLAGVEKKLRDVESKAFGAGKKTGTAFGKGTKQGLSSVDVFKGFLAAEVATRAMFALTSGLRNAIQGARDFSKATAEINSILPKTGQLTKETTREFIELQKTFGLSATQQAKSFYAIVSAGVQGTAKQLKTLNVANRAAIAGLVDISDASRVLVSSVNAYASSGVTATEASDALFVAVREGQTTFGELASSLGQVAPLASSAGLSFSEMAGTLAFITKSGVSTAEAVTQLKAIMTAFIKPTDQLTKALDGASLQTNSFAELMQILKEKTGGSNQALAKIFPNVRALSGAVTITNGNIKDFNRILGETSMAAGSTSAAFKTITDQDIDFKINKMSGQFSAFALDLTNAVLPSIVSIGEALTDIFLTPITANEISLDEQILKKEKTILGIKKRIADVEANDSFIGKILGRREDNENQLAKAIIGMDELIEKRRELNASTQGEGGFVGPLERPDPVVPDSTALKTDVFTLGKLFEETSSKFTSGAVTITKGMSRISIGAGKLGNAFKKGFGGAISSGFASFGAALVNGENALDAFLKSFLSALGQMMIQQGTMFIMQGLGFSVIPGLQASSGVLLATGAALAVAGGALTAIGGGGGESPAATAGGSAGSLDTQVPVEEQQIQDEERNPEQKVVINISGDVLDSEETGLRIVRLLNDQFENTGSTLVSV